MVFNKKILFFLLLWMNSLLSATEFTICSFNCGGLSSHYDYLRAAVNQKLMQARHVEEPEQMALINEIQNVALKILFAPTSEEKKRAQYTWAKNGFQKHAIDLLMPPVVSGSPNAKWNQKFEEALSSYKVRPISLMDEEVSLIVEEHLQDLSRGKADMQAELLDEAYAIMAKRIFAHALKFDIICLQEADYLDVSFFPKNYELKMSLSAQSKNGIAWNTDRFELTEMSEGSGALILVLTDKNTGLSLAVASAHLTGCNPFFPEYDQTGVSDALKGDFELRSLLHQLKKLKSEMTLIGMDANVTALHPRLRILKDAEYKMDPHYFIEPTCTNPHYLLDTRIDWIAIKPTAAVKMTNLPVFGLGLNNIYNNMSDHRPIAAKISY